METYFSRYPGVHDFMERTRQTARDQGFVETLFGRRLYLPDIGAGNQQRRQAAERAAINAPMQGTAADIIKMAMLAVYGWIESGTSGATMVMQVHDELVFEVKEARVEEASARIRELMAGAAKLAVPLVVDVGVGSNWEEAH